MANEVHIGDLGTIFRVTIVEDSVAIDISTATIKNLHFKKPQTLSVLTVVGVFTTDGTDGQIQHTVTSGQLDEAGCWRIQAEIGFASGSVWSGEIGDFMVYPNLYT